MTINFGQPAHGSSRRSGHSHGLTWVLWRLLVWASRWVGRATFWTGRQAVRRTAGHVSRTRATWRAWSDMRGEHGLRTWIAHDAFTGEKVDARSVRVDAPTGGDPNIRARQASDAASVRDHIRRQHIERMISKRVRPPLWERLLARTGLHTIDWTPYEESLRARMRVMDQYRERLAREGALYGQSQPAPDGWATFGRYSGGTAGWGRSDSTPAGSTPNGGAPHLIPTSPTNDFTGTPYRVPRTKGDGSVVNTVNTWNDLPGVSIDPVDFPEELPQHFWEVARLLGNESAMIEGAAETGARGAVIFGGYVEYLNTAAVADTILSPLVDAREEINNCVQFIRQAAEAMNRAASLAEQAQRAAEKEYGDWEVPDFHRANRGH